VAPAGATPSEEDATAELTSRLDLDDNVAAIAAHVATL
jgi:hypothetical protein